MIKSLISLDKSLIEANFSIEPIQIAFKIQSQKDSSLQENNYYHLKLSGKNFFIYPCQIVIKSIEGRLMTGSQRY